MSNFNMCGTYSCLTGNDENNNRQQNLMQYLRQLANPIGNVSMHVTLKKLGMKIIGHFHIACCDMLV